MPRNAQGAGGPVVNGRGTGIKTHEITTLMKLTSITVLAVTAILSSSVSFGAPRSQKPPPAPQPLVTAVVSAQEKAGCTRMIVRVPGRKTPKSVACAPAVCAKIPACAQGCQAG